MDWEAYTDLMINIRKLTKNGWVYLYSVENNVDNIVMKHEQHGIHNFTSWLDLMVFVGDELKSL